MWWQIDSRTNSSFLYAFRHTQHSSFIISGMAFITGIYSFNISLFKAGTSEAITLNYLLKWIYIDEIINKASRSMPTITKIAHKGK